MLSIREAPSNIFVEKFWKFKGTTYVGIVGLVCAAEELIDKVYQALSQTDFQSIVEEFERCYCNPDHMAKLCILEVRFQVPSSILMIVDGDKGRSHGVLIGGGGSRIKRFGVLAIGIGEAAATSYLTTNMPSAHDEFDKVLALVGDVAKPSWRSQTQLGGQERYLMEASANRVQT